LSPRRAAKLLALVFLAGILLAAGTLYLMSRAVPSRYRPAQLSHPQREEAAKHFYGKVMDFDDQAQAGASFDLSVTQEEMNSYLASLDEIAALLPDGASGRVDGLLEAAGLADPAVAMGEGMMTLMVRSTRYDNRLVSADVAFRFTPDHRLRVRLDHTRIGSLTVPEEIVRRRLDLLKEALAERASHGDSGKGRDNPESQGPIGAVGGAAAQVIRAAIEGETIVPEGGWRGWRLRVEEMRIDPGKLTLRLRPLGRQRDDAGRQR
jgi:hypothetical protein